MTTANQTINVQPTWAAVAAMMIIVLQDGNTEGKQMAKDEILKMGMTLDRIIASPAPEPAPIDETQPLYALIWGSFEAGELDYKPAVDLKPAGYFTKDLGYSFGELVSIKNLSIGSTLALSNHRIFRLS